MSTNLIADLGAEYCNQLLAGALFNYKGEAHEFVAARQTKTKPLYVSTACYSGTPEHPDSSVRAIPAEEFTGWKSLSFPTLGYRQAANGQALFYITRHN